MVALLSSVLGLSGCLFTQANAPVEKRTLPGQQTPYSKKDRADYPRHVVQKGETLYSIATRHGFYYKELASWNNIGAPFLIRPRQVLRLSPPGPHSPVSNRVASSAAPGWRHPKRQMAQVETNRPAASSGGPDLSQRPLPPPKASVASRKASPAPAQSPPEKLPTGKPAPPELPAAHAAKPTASPKKHHYVAKKKPAPMHATPAPKPPPKKKAARPGSNGWHWPSQGKLVRNFTQSGNRGLDISGRFGAPVRAAGPGRVVYTGSGLRGYGKLIIIKHDSQILSAYGNNERMLVREGDKVEGGQKIAEMGKDSANRAMLHFEIRKGGKPINPLRYLGSSK
nr:MAG: lipoprotein NlpD [Candidatus Kentron sp. DK]